MVSSRLDSILGSLPSSPCCCFEPQTLSPRGIDTTRVPTVSPSLEAAALSGVLVDGVLPSCIDTFSSSDPSFPCNGTAVKTGSSPSPSLLSISFFSAVWKCRTLVGDEALIADVSLDLALLSNDSCSVTGKRGVASSCCCSSASFKAPSSVSQDRSLGFFKRAAKVFLLFSEAELFVLLPFFPVASRPWETSAEFATQLILISFLSRSLTSVGL